MLAKKDFRQIFTGIITIAVIVSYILVFVGCNSTSPGVPGLYVIKLANNKTNASVRIGLFSLCAGIEDATVSNSNLTCAGTLGSAMSNVDAKTTGSSTSAKTKYYLPGTTLEAEAALQPLLALADGIQSGSTGPGGVLSIIYIPLMFSALCFVAAGGSLIAHRVFSRAAAANHDDGADEKVFLHQRKAWSAAMMLTTGAIMGAVAAAISTTVAVRALLFSGTSLPGSTSAASTTTIGVSGGTSVQVLEWLIVVFVILWHPILEPVWQRFY